MYIVSCRLVSLCTSSWCRKHISCVSTSTETARPRHIGGGCCGFLALPWNIKAWLMALEELRLIIQDRRHKNTWCVQKNTRALHAYTCTHAGNGRRKSCNLLQSAATRRSEWASHRKVELVLNISEQDVLSNLNTIKKGFDSNYHSTRLTESRQLSGLCICLCNL